MYGYRVGEVVLPDELPIKDDFQIKLTALPETDRRPVGVLYGPGFEGVCLPKPDFYDTPSKILGASKRAGCQIPEAYPGFYKEFREFVRKWIRTNLKPLARDSDTSVEHWLDKTNYPLWRKQELLEASLQDTTPKTYNVKALSKMKPIPSINIREESILEVTNLRP